MDKFDWGTTEEESPEQVAEALQKVKAESRHRRAKRQTLIGATGAILLVAAFVGGTQLNFNSKEEKKDVTLAQSEAPAPSDTVTTVGGPSTSAAKDPIASRPSALYVAKNNNDGTGRIAVIDTRTGKETKTLATGGTMNELALTPDGKTLFYTENDKSTQPAEWRGVFDLMTSLKSIPVDGGTSTFYKYNAYTPRVSPDGKRVAVAELGMSGVSGQAFVVDIASKQVKPLDEYPENAPVSNENGWISNIAGWTDNTHVAAVANVFENPKLYLHIFDTTKVEYDTDVYKSANGNNVFTFPKISENTLYRSVVLPNSSIFTVEDNGNNTAARMLILDGKKGTVTKLVATGYVGRGYGNPATDASGNHLIYMSGGDVRVSDFGGNPEVFTTGVTSAAWH